jgi:chromosomal replication initiator protein
VHSANDVLAHILNLLEKQITKVTIDTWFSDATAVALKQDCFIIRTTSPFKKQVIDSRYGDMVRAILQELFSADMGFMVLVGDELDSLDSLEEDEVPSDKDEEYYTFEDFVVGSSNRFAHAAALAVATNPAQTYNPLFIYGGSGLGKTHLIKAIAHTMRRDRPDFRVIYIKGDDFINELIKDLSNQKMEEFHNKYRMADLLLLDDIQFIAGKEQTQIEFFHTFNALYDANKQIVITSDRPPKELYSLHSRLQTRFEWGLLADIQPPDYETRIAIIKKKAERSNIEIPDNLIQYIANNVTANIRQLEGIVLRTKACRELLQEEITMDTINQAIRDILKENPGMKPTASIIISEVCKYYGVAPDLIKSSNRRKDVLLPRQVASYIMRQLTDLSLPEIGKELGGQHYSTIINSIDRITEKMKTDPLLENVVKDLISNISET